MVSTTEVTTLTKKRPRASRSPDGDDKRRGRPRVEKEDESAADRRRTQIRMAQRAYRQRKENTLDEYRKRVTDLTNTIELMNKSFLQCRDRLYESNLNQDQMLDLHNVAIEFEDLLKASRNPSEEVTVDIFEPGQSKPKTAKSSDSIRKTSLEAQNVPFWLDQSAVALSQKPKSSIYVDVGLGYRSILPDIDSTTSTAPNIERVEPTGPIPEITMSSDWQNSPESISIDILSEPFPMTKPLTPPWTYSFQETTFARRIYRSCVERGYQMLLDPRRHPTEIMRKFKLSLMGRDKSKLIASFKKVLTKGPHEELDNWQAPLIHVGGAGTHYPRRDPFGNLVPRKSTYHLGIIGPQTLALLENASRDNISTDMTVEIAGFEGEWFDPYDVQGYLEEKGIFIDPSSSFAEAELVEWSPSPSNSSSPSAVTNLQPSSLTAGPSIRSTPLTQSHLASLNRAGADLSQWNDYTDMELGAVGFSDARMGSWMNFLQPGEGIKTFGSAPVTAENMTWENFVADTLMSEVNDPIMPLSNPPTPPPRRKNVIIDVSRLVDVLTATAACIGRAPGFRRRDVDRALAISSFDAF